MRRLVLICLVAVSVALTGCSGLSGISSSSDDDPRHNYYSTLENKDNQTYQVDLYVVREPITGVQATYLDGHTGKITDVDRLSNAPGSGLSNVSDIEPLGKQLRSTNVTLKSGETNQEQWITYHNATVMYVVEPTAKDKPVKDVGIATCGQEKALGNMTLTITEKGDVSSKTYCHQ